MNEQRSLTLNGMTGKHLLLIGMSILMAVSSLYLLNHHFETFYPTGMAKAAICNISDFFSCDATAYSPISSIYSVPIALFGMLAGLFLLFGSILPSEKMEGTNRLFAKLNFAGCILLFFYSIGILGYLCPVCTLYYIFSGVACYLFFRHSNIGVPSIKIILSYALVTIIISAGTILYVQGKDKKNDILTTALLKDYYSYPNLGVPSPKSPFRLASATEKFEDAPIQISIFSDFQCPACELLSEMMEKIVIRYKGKINIQYYFYPLDMSCNKNMTRPLHTLACKSSYLATCLPNKFVKTHNDIFKQIEDISAVWLDSYAKNEGVLDCTKDQKTKDTVLSLIEAATPFNVQSTPTMLVNGVKIEGALPLNQMYIILDDLAKKNASK